MKNLRNKNLEIRKQIGAVSKEQLAIMNNAYAYDAVDNVLSVANTAPERAMSHNYSYDGLYRLVSASGNYSAGNNKTAGYTLEMQYDNLHNIVSKKQHLTQQDIQFDGVLKAGYELNYNYQNNPFQISTLDDENYRTEGQNTPNDLTKRTGAYEYDANGNLVYINTAREHKDGTKQEKSTERKLLWDEENRLEAIYDNGFVSNYWYDAAGERTVKTSGESEQMFVNGLFSGGSTETARFSAYINPYMVVSQGGNYTKHIYIGSQRIVSKLGDLDSYGADPRRIEYAGANVDGANVKYAEKYLSLQQTIKDRYAAFKVEYYGKDNDDYVNGQGFCCEDAPQNAPARAPSANDNPELFQYYYHSDHLGSTSLITNLDGEIVQHVEYVPFGEVFIEERNNTWNTPYLFNAKELDEETGLYYYGARYYEPRVSLWYGADPMQEKYPGVSTYAYCVQNPVKFIDPDGNEPVIAFFTLKKDRKFLKSAQNHNSPIGDNNFAVFAHANNRGLRFKEGKDGFANTPQKINQALSDASSEWKTSMENGEEMTVTFYACNMATEDENGNSIAKAFSKAYPNVTVVAANGTAETIDLGPFGAYEIGVKNEGENGAMITFKNGEEIKRNDNANYPTSLYIMDTLFGTNKDKPKDKEKIKPEE
jgi:RHS repeat-associated protein